MIEESLKTYRAERRAFIINLKHYFNIDFYKMDAKERSYWFSAYLNAKRDFFWYFRNQIQENFQLIPKEGKKDVQQFDPTERP